MPASVACRAQVLRSGSQAFRSLPGQSIEFSSRKFGRTIADNSGTTHNFADNEYYAGTRNDACHGGACLRANTPE